MMDPYEGYPVRYTRTALPIVTESGVVDAWVYNANEAHVAEGLAPARWYLNHLLAGRGLPFRTLFRIAFPKQTVCLILISSQLMLAAEQISEIFNRCFYQSKTRLIGGASEPLYEPGEQEARVYFREDYASSALHEIAHWCIAGANRRQQTDYGYWYNGERDLGQQRTFEAVESKATGAGVDFQCRCGHRISSELWTILMKVRST